MMPPLPEQLCHADGNYTEAQLLEYGRQCVEAAAKLCEKQVFTDAAAKRIRNMLKGETE
jgi:hypothetical protein